MVEPQEVDTVLEGYGEDYVVDAAEPFDFELLPGFMDGDYPPWLYSTAEDLLPKVFIERYGKYVTSFVSGSWWEFPVGALEEMTAELDEAGFSVAAILSYSRCRDDCESGGG